MSNFLKVYRNVTRCCEIFSHQHKSGIVLNWKWSQTVLPEGNTRSVSRGVNCSTLFDHHTSSPGFERALLSQHLLSLSWNMKTKHVKSRGCSNSTHKKKKHKHKEKKSKKKSKDKSKLAMAAAKEILLEDHSSSDSDIQVVFEAKKPLCPKQKVPAQVEEILLDDGSQFGSVNPFSLNDIPLPQESHIFVDLATIPLPQEKPLPDNVEINSYIKTDNQITVTVIEKEVRTDIASNSSATNMYSYENEGLGNEGTAFSVMSYNILAQKLLESHNFLYTGHDKRCLAWDHRKKTLLNEFRTANADVLCLQEVQFDHLEWFNDQFTELGYMGLYKRRTHDHVDGCAIYFKRDRFRLLESSSVEYYQPGVKILNRDNVALIARLEVIGSDQQLIVATTHLLFNPKRHDIKLAQMQLLLAELERIAYLRYDLSLQKSLYRPVIITGDFNLQPNSNVYRFIRDGYIDFSVSIQPPKNTTFFQDRKRTFSQQSSLLPRHLQVSNTCQHLYVLQDRQIQRRETLEGLLNELRSLKLYNSDNLAFIKQYGSALSTSSHDPDGRQNQAGPHLATNLIQGFDAPATTSSENGGETDGMEPGMLSHSFHLKSVYRHLKTNPSSVRSQREATTHQNAWVTVDYIFYSGLWNQVQKATEEGPLKLVSRLGLPTEEQCQAELKHIPNMACGSDHLPLLARFLLR